MVGLTCSGKGITPPKKCAAIFPAKNGEKVVGPNLHKHSSYLRGSGKSLLTQKSRVEDGVAQYPVEVGAFFFFERRSTFQKKNGFLHPQKVL